MELIQLLVYADANLLGENINSIKKNRESVLDARKEVAVEVSIEKTIYTCVCNLSPECKTRS
jgi:hypothetical protein